MSPGRGKHACSFQGGAVLAIARASTRDLWRVTTRALYEGRDACTASPSITMATRSVALCRPVWQAHGPLAFSWTAAQSSRSKRTVTHSGPHERERPAGGDALTYNVKIDLTPSGCPSAIIGRPTTCTWRGPHQPRPAAAAGVPAAPGARHAGSPEPHTPRGGARRLPAGDRRWRDAARAAQLQRHLRRGAARPAGAGGADRTMRAGLEHHLCLTYGDDRAELRALAGLLGLEALEPTRRRCRRGPKTEDGLCRCGAWGAHACRLPGRHGTILADVPPAIHPATTSIIACSCQAFWLAGAARLTGQDGRLELHALPRDPDRRWPVRCVQGRHANDDHARLDAAGSAPARR